jgi:adenylate kinase
MSELAVTLTVDQLRDLMRSAAREAVAQVQFNPAREVMTLAQCAEFLDRHPKVITQLVREKGLPAHFISEREPRFKRSEVLTWLDTLPTSKPNNEAA